MKKLISLLLALMISFGLCYAETVPVDGGWQPAIAEAQALPEDAQAAFDQATNGLEGAVYTPVALLSEQVVAGTNYCILCQITPVVPDAVPTWNLVYIYADPEGNAAIQNIWEIYIEKHAQP